MVVLRTDGASYWVVNTLLDRLSNETMIAIAQEPAPAREGEPGASGGSLPLRLSCRAVMSASEKRIAVFGAGYVGLVTGACFAELGHRVSIRDVIPDEVDALRRGEVPIYEPGLDELLERNRERLVVHDRRRQRRSTARSSSTSPSGRRRPTPATPTSRLSGRCRRAARRRPADRRRDEEHRSRSARARRSDIASTRAGSVTSATSRIPSSRPRARRSRTSWSRTGS